MKFFLCLLVTIIITACQQKPDDVMSTDAIHFSGIFITDYIKSDLSLHIKESTVIKDTADSTYHVSGLVEGYTSFHVPVNVNHFSEVIHYLGGDPSERKNWACVEIYIGDKRMK
jgi:hypothetical protein